MPEAYGSRNIVLNLQDDPEPNGDIENAAFHSILDWLDEFEDIRAAGTLNYYSKFTDAFGKLGNGFISDNGSVVSISRATLIATSLDVTNDAVKTISLFGVGGFGYFLGGLRVGTSEQISKANFHKDGYGTGSECAIQITNGSTGLVDKYSGVSLGVEENNGAAFLRANGYGRFDLLMRPAVGVTESVLSASASSQEVSVGFPSYGTVLLNRPTSVTGQLDANGLKSNTSVWDAAHIIFGTYHLWITVGGAAPGVLMIKNGAPTSDTDGTVVGSQA